METNIKPGSKLVLNKDFGHEEVTVIENDEDTWPDAIAVRTQDGVPFHVYQDEIDSIEPPAPSLDEVQIPEAWKAISDALRKVFPPEPPKPVTDLKQPNIGIAFSDTPGEDPMRDAVAFDFALLSAAGRYDRQVWFNYRHDCTTTYRGVVPTDVSLADDESYVLFGGPDAAKDGEYRSFRTDRLTSPFELEQ